jgi:hypothetical protein
MYMSAVYVFAGLTVGNFIGQAFGKRDWRKATDRSFFQAVAIGTFLFLAVK